MARAKQPVSVDDIEFDALIDSEEGYEADVPEYPTEKGFSVSDTIVLKADTLNMTLYVTDTPVTWRERTGSGPGKTEGVVRRLKDLYFAKKILEVTTTDCVYSNMVITSMNIKKSVEVGYAREIPIAFKNRHRRNPGQLRQVGQNCKSRWKSKHHRRKYGRKRLVRRLLCIRFFVQL